MTNTKFRDLLKRATYASTGIMVARISTAFAGILIARTVGPRLFGIYATVWALIELGSAFSRTGLSIGLKRDAARNFKELPTLLANTLFVIPLLYLLGAANVFYWGIASNRSTEAASLFWPLAIAGFSFVCTQPFDAVLQVQRRQKVMAFIHMGRGLLFLIGVGILAIMEADVITIAWYQGILYFITLILLASIVLSHVCLKLEVSKIWSQLIGSLVFWLSTIIFTFSSRTPLLILAHFRPEEEVGYFAVAFRFISLSMLIGGTANNDAFVPALFGLYGKHRDQFRNVCGSMQRVFIPLGIFIASTIFVCADSLIVLLQGEEYRPAVGVLQMLCLLVIFHYFGLSPDGALTASKRVWIKTMIQGFVSIAAFILGILVIKKFGIVGASLIAIAASLFKTLFYHYDARKHRLLAKVQLLKIMKFSGLVLFLAGIFTVMIPNHYVLRPLIFIFSCLLFSKFIAAKEIQDLILIIRSPKDAT